MKHIINSIFVGIVTWFWASVYWMNPLDYWFVHQHERPWIRRHLVISLIDVLEYFTVPEMLATVIIVTLSGVGFYIALALLVKETRNQVAEWKILGVVLLGMWFFHWCRVPYDLLTAFLWTLSLLFIVKQRHGWFMLLFPLVCLNRIETAPLLIVAYYLRFPKMYGPIVYSVGVVITTIAWLGMQFGNVPGTNTIPDLIGNFVLFWQTPQTSVLHLCISVVIMLRIVKRYNYQPLIFQRWFGVLAPVFLILYWTFGQAFELRVFWELWPIISILILV